MVIRREDADWHGPLGWGATPVLIVEVLSPSNRDYERLAKRALYEAAGVPGPWMVDPARPSLTALRLEAGSYVVEAEVAGDETSTTEEPFPVASRPTDLLR